MVAVVIKPRYWRGLVVSTLAICLPSNAAVLPEDRADALYHRYEGGGVTIDGPSIQVRKQLGNRISVSGKYYVDSISSASIDVQTYASPYTEERTEKNASIDFLNEKTTVSLSYTNSDENDYEANTGAIAFSHDMFGDLTTLSIAYSLGMDDVFRTTALPEGGRDRDPDFAEEVTRYGYFISLSQILTPSLIVSFNFDRVAEEGFLNNPYRQVRYLDSDPNNPDGFSFQFENYKYPTTRTSRAAAIRAKYFLPYRASIGAEYRLYSDTWGISASNYKLEYTHALVSGWIFDVRYRFYSQDQADFYSDLFPHENAQNYMARDKELSTYTSTTFGLGVSYDILRGGWGIFDKGSLNVAYDRISFDYDNFRDITNPEASDPGQEPLYSFDADVWQLYLSLWY